MNASLNHAEQHPENNAEPLVHFADGFQDGPSRRVWRVRFHRRSPPPNASHIGVSVRLNNTHHRIIHRFLFPYTVRRSGIGARADTPLQTNPLKTGERAELPNVLIFATRRSLGVSGRLYGKRVLAAAMTFRSSVRIAA